VAVDGLALFRIGTLIVAALYYVAFQTIRVPNTTGITP